MRCLPIWTLRLRVGIENGERGVAASAPDCAEPVPSRFMPCALAVGAGAPDRVRRIAEVRGYLRYRLVVPGGIALVADVSDRDPAAVRREAVRHVRCEPIFGACVDIDLLEEGVWNPGDIRAARLRAARDEGGAPAFGVRVGEGLVVYALGRGRGAVRHRCGAVRHRCGFVFAGALGCRDGAILGAFTGARETGEGDAAARREHDDGDDTGGDGDGARPEPPAGRGDCGRVCPYRAGRRRIRMHPVVRGGGRGG